MTKIQMNCYSCGSLIKEIGNDSCYVYVKCTQCGEKSHRVNQYVVDLESLDTAQKKIEARRIYVSAVHDGTLVPESCEVCGKKFEDNGHKCHGHHPNYRYPLLVNWLCAKHHCDRHRGNQTSHFYQEES